LQGVILLNKVDLCENIEEPLSQVIKIAGETPVIKVSAAMKTGLEQLYDYMTKGKTVVFLGSSGVGKSTLLNSLANEEVQITSNTSEHSGKGRHTTTHRQMFFLPSGCMIIDTPGMREIQLWAEVDDLNFVYKDIVDIISQCKFSNCTHQNEPGCAVKAALENGTITQERYERYLMQQRELTRLGEKKKEYDRRLKKKGNVK
jgi:ribosome biogenesis GTPase